MKTIYLLGIRDLIFRSFIPFFLLFSFSTFAQVGIGTTAPNANALLDIDASMVPGGLLMPRVALSALNNPAPLSNPIPAGMTVYNTATGGSGVFAVSPGFYYHNGTQWVRIGDAQVGPTNQWMLLGNAGTNANNDFLGTTDNIALRFRTNNANRFEVSTTGNLRAYADGSAGAPIYSWTANTEMGMYRIGVNTLGFSTTSLERMRILADGRVTVNSAGAYPFMLNSIAAGTNGSIIGASVNGTAVQGQASGSGDGIVGAATSGTGVYGQATLANAEGGFFVNTQANGLGLVALAGGASYNTIATTGTGAAITGRLFGTTSFATAVDGTGIAGVGDGFGNLLPYPLGVGVVGMGKEAGVFGDSSYFSSIGVHGRGEGISSLNAIGVYGEMVSGPGFGVAGESNNVGVYGWGAYGALFEAAHNDGFGAIIANATASGANRIGLFVAGQNLGLISLPGTGAIFRGNLSAGVGFGANANSTGLIGSGNNITTASVAQNGSGVAGTGNSVGLYGKANIVASGIGVIGAGNNLGTYSSPNVGAGVAGTGVNIGVYGHATDAAGFGVYSSGDFLADGNIHATGDITAVGTIYAPRGIITDGFAVAEGNMAIGGTFSARMISTSGDLISGGTINSVIDDPRDPANKYLKHASIESNEILNLYRGVSTFDASGEAVVQLPDYYDAINKNASYQLTPIGASMPDLYIASEVNNGSFKISGGIVGKKVSWTLTAERNDPYIRLNPEIRNMVVDKGADRGRYLAPEQYGQSADRGIFRERVSEMLSASMPSTPKQSISVQENQSQTMEASKLDSEDVQNLGTSLKSNRTKSTGVKELRNISLENVEIMEVSSKVLEQDSGNEVQSSNTSQKNTSKTRD